MRTHFVGDGAARCALVALLAGIAPCQEWTQSSSAQSPGALAGYTVLMEPRCVALPGGPIVLFGGRSAFPHLYSNRTMTFDGTDWTLEQVAAPASLVGRRRPYMAYCAATDSIAMFGGLIWSGVPQPQETFHYDHATRTWTEVESGLQPGVTSPPQTWGYGCCRTATGMLLVGGPSGPGNGESWHWDGSSWTLLATPTPIPRVTDPFVAYDTDRNVVVMFGGSQLLLGPGNATWEFDGTDWQQVVTPDAPPARNASFHGAMTYDPRRGVCVLHGGSSSAFNFMNDVWEYDGQDWVRTDPVSPGPSDQTHVFVYDETIERVLAFGVVNQAVDETWLYEGPRARCQQVGHGCIGSAGVPELAAAASSGAAFGMRFEFTVTGSALGLTLLGAATTATPGVALSPVGFPGGCLGYPTAIEASAVLAGDPAFYSLTVPWQPSLTGARFFVQGLCLDVTGTTVPFVVSNAGRCGVF